MSALTHLLAMIAALDVLATMRRRARVQGLPFWPLFAFGAGMVLCYGASATYHALVLPERQLNVFRLIDHSAVYLLIAGSYTPIVYFLMPSGTFRRSLLRCVWAAAAVGIAAKWWFTEVPYWGVVAPYVMLGWLGLIPVRTLVRAIGGRKLLWIAAGGVFYTVGALIDLLGVQRLAGQAFGAHETFHLLTMAGTACHVVFVFRCLLPFLAAQRLTSSWRKSPSNAGSSIRVAVRNPESTQTIRRLDLSSGE